MPAWALAAGEAKQPLNLLILGGTGFIGPHQVRFALSRGHQVTLFNRGRTNPGMFPEAEKLRGDRASDLSALEGRSWDVVIDNTASIPRWVSESAGLLADAAPMTWIFWISWMDRRFRQD